MGRFDGPHFDDEGSNIVSVWASKVPMNDVPDDYFEEHYGDDNDVPFNRFSSDFGFGFYDHDFTTSSFTRGSTNEERIAAASYGRSFAKEASEACTLPSVEWFFMIYDFIYDPEITGISESRYFKFVGSFPYDENAA